MESAYLNTTAVTSPAGRGVNRPPHEPPADALRSERRPAADRSVSRVRPDGRARHELLSGLRRRPARYGTDWRRLDRVLHGVRRTRRPRRRVLHELRSAVRGRRAARGRRLRRVTRRPRCPTRVPRPSAGPPRRRLGAQRGPRRSSRARRQGHRLDPGPRPPAPDDRRRREPAVRLVQLLRAGGDAPDRRRRATPGLRAVRPRTKRGPARHALRLPPERTAAADRARDGRRLGRGGFGPSRAVRARVRRDRDGAVPVRGAAA